MWTAPYPANLILDVLTPNISKTKWIIKIYWIYKFNACFIAHTGMWAHVQTADVCWRRDTHMVHRFSFNLNCNCHIKHMASVCVCLYVRSVVPVEWRIGLHSGLCVCVCYCFPAEKAIQGQCDPLLEFWHTVSQIGHKMIIKNYTWSKSQMYLKMGFINTIWLNHIKSVRPY